MVAALAGCASSPMASKEQDAISKTFRAPSPSMAGVYIYRNGIAGPSIKKIISIDGKTIGAIAPNTFYHREIPAGMHTVSTDSDFGENSISINVEAGKNYYIHHYIKLVSLSLTGAAGLEQVIETDGQKGVLECEEAR